MKYVPITAKIILVEMFAMISLVVQILWEPLSECLLCQKHISLAHFKTKEHGRRENSREIVNPHAGGIDVGSRSHWVAVSQQESDVREFSVFYQNLFEMADWLKEKQVKTIAMESTGAYWQNLYAVPVSKGFHVILCNGKFTKNIKGKKTDIKDCQWIQKLHSLGLLTSSFLPDGKNEELRTYCRQKANLIHLAASTSKKMQKNHRLLNLRLDVVVKDICGLTGLLIIREIYKNETNPEKFASLRHGNCRKSKEEIAKALQSNGREDYLFALLQELDTYDHLQKKIQQRDVEIQLSDFFQRINFRKGRVSVISAAARKLAVIN